MKIRDFELEVYFGRHEFSAKYLLAQSDCESMSIGELLSYEPGAEKEFLNDRLGYTQVSGNPELRRSIAALYSTMTEENILVHVGAQEAIFNFMNVFLDKGDHVICQFPAYQSLFEIAETIGCEVTRWPLMHGSNGWTINVGQIEQMLRPNTKLLILNSPNNPTGYTLQKEELDKITELARKHHLYVFSDEVYKGLELDGASRPWLADCYEKGVSLGVMSKSYGLAGLRIGWIAAQDKEILERLAKMKHYTSICSSAPSEFLALLALKHGNEILKRNVAIINSNLNIADDFFNRHTDLFEFSKPTAGPIAFVKLKTQESAEIFCEALLQKKSVLLLPAKVYLYKKPYFRMGFGRKNFSEGLAKLGDFIKEEY